jgi:phosphatidylinositol alpha-1,6-mannosyltransferase
MVQLTPGVDTQRHTPDVDGRAVRARYHLGSRPVIVCVSRLIRRKGQDKLIDALPAIREQVPDAALLLVGDGPYRRSLQRRARRRGVAEHVVFTSAVRWEETPDFYAAGNVFCMPARTRRLGLEVEGLGICYLEAAAHGLPVIAGRSGGAPDAVQDGVTGFIVDGGRPGEIAERCAELLLDRDLADRMGRAGRAWVVGHWRWEVMVPRLVTLLGLPELGASEVWVSDTGGH